MRQTGFVFLILALSSAIIMAGCASPQQTAADIPTIDPDSLTVTPAPTATPLPTYTPFPTAQRMASSTPIPSLPPRDSSTDGTVEPTLTLTPTVTPTSGPTATPLPPQGAQDVGETAPDLVPVLTILDTGATCGKQGILALMQVGVTNRGNWSAQNFTVEWSIGWEDPFKGEVRHEFISFQEWGLQWTQYFLNEYVWVPCEETTTYTAYVLVDTGNNVAEHYEDNNFAEMTYTITYQP